MRVSSRAALDSEECAGTFGTGSRVLAIEGASEESFAAGHSAVASLGLNDADLVIAISASGGTGFVWGGIAAAFRSSSTSTPFVALITCNPRLRLGSLVPHLLLPLDLGPELLTGSTRLKGGTATKCLLNALSTLACVRAGLTSGNLMTRAVPVNRKIQRRLARALVASSSRDPDHQPSISEAEAERLLASHSYDFAAAQAALLSQFRSNRR